MKQYRTQLQKDHDSAEIARLVLEGHRQVEIAHRLGLSPQLVSQEIKKLSADWRRSMFEDTLVHKATELKRLNYIEAELWVAWEKSKTEGRTRSEQWVIPAEPTEVDPTPKPVTVRASLTVESDAGDPRYIAAILKVVVLRIKLLGLDAPVSVASSTGFSDVTKMSARERASRIVEILETVRHIEPCSDHAHGSSSFP